MGDFLDLLRERVASEHHLPFEVKKVPHSDTQRAINQLQRGKGKKFKTIGSLIKDLNADD